MAYNSVEDLINAGFYGYRGWNTPEALANFAATGGSGKGGPSASVSTSTPGISVQTQGGQTFDPIATARQLLSFQQEAAKPAIGGLEATKEPLKQRYTALIDEIKGKAKTAVEQTGTRLSREFGARGIPLVSDVFQRQLQEEQTRTQEPFLAQQRLTEAGRETDLANIALQISQLQAGQPATAAQQALSLLETQAALAKPTELQTEVVTAGGRKRLVNKQTGEVIADLGASTEGTEGLDLSGLLGLFGGGTTAPTEPKPTYKPGSSKPTSGPRGGFGITTQGYA